MSSCLGGQTARHLDGCMAKPKPTPDEPMKRTTLKVPETLHIQLAHAAIDEGRDMQEILADALRQYFAAQKKARK